MTCSNIPVDTDNDGLPDAWEAQYGLNVNDASDALLDGDGDQLNNLAEFSNKTNPNVSDTDSDQLFDGEEVNTHGTDPTKNDSDLDTMPDGWEVTYSLNPLDSSDSDIDSDEDGYVNNIEYKLGSDPKNADSTPEFVSNYSASFESGLPISWTIPSSSNGPWKISSDYSTDGLHSLKAETITHSRIAQTKYVNNFEGGVLAFDYKVSSESSYDFFIVTLNSIEVLKVSGEDSGRFETQLTRGFNEIVFSYEKDGSVNEGLDSAWIDNFTVTTADADNDGMNDRWETANGLDPTNPEDASTDLDGDGISNLEEYINQTNPQNTDTDSDGLSDMDEMVSGTNPNNSDSDSDGLPDGWESQNNLDPLDSSDAHLDKDSDGFTNTEEFRMGTNPDNAESYPNFIFTLHQSFETGVPANWTQPDSVDKGWGISDENTTDGIKSISSESIIDGQSAGIQFEEYFAEGTLSLDYFIDSEPSYDFLSVIIDGNVIEQISGYNSGTFEITISEGLRQVQFKYHKDYSISNGKDMAWIDNVRFAAKDTDNDGMADSWENRYGLDINNASDASLDNDGDKLTNLEEHDANTLPDLSDSDGDSLSDHTEVKVSSSNPRSSDSDSDTLPDAWEFNHGLDPNNVLDKELDSDLDGLTNIQEYLTQTHPMNADSDEDGMSDGWEVSHNLDPNVNDSNLDQDGDNLTALQEFNIKTDPNSRDSDGDTLPDDWEHTHKLDPTDPTDAAKDSDGDSLSNLREYQTKTDPLNSDSDGDGLSDGKEVLEANSNPLDPDTDKDGLPDGTDPAPTQKNENEGSGSSGGSSSVFWLLGLLTLAMVRRKKQI
nr:GlyGly-CTERM sorting domain-containing protein [Vibrio nigripulchritudo]